LSVRIAAVLAEMLVHLFAANQSAESSIKPNENFNWNIAGQNALIRRHTITCGRCEAEKEFCYEASKNDSQIACGFGRHIDRFIRVRGAGCAP
jgi:hypothetical protein